MLIKVIPRDDVDSRLHSGYGTQHWIARFPEPHFDRVHCHHCHPGMFLGIKNYSWNKIMTRVILLLPIISSSLAVLVLGLLTKFWVSNLYRLIGTKREISTPSSCTFSTVRPSLLYCSVFCSSSTLVWRKRHHDEWTFFAFAVGREKLIIQKCFCVFCFSAGAFIDWCTY